MDYTIITKHSEIITLLKVFQDKKSGKVIESRKILKDSFYFFTAERHVIGAQSLFEREQDGYGLGVFENAKTMVSGTYATSQKKMAICSGKRSGPFHHT